MPRFRLIQQDSGFELIDSHQAPLALRIDFGSSKLQHRATRGGKKELLLRAVDAKPGLRVMDCTAGLGTDSFLLANAGCIVTMLERSKILSILLRGALQANVSQEIQPTLSRMHLIEADAKDVLFKMSEAGSTGEGRGDTLPDVILIDPMFPSRRKQALVNGSMQMLQNFVGKDQDATELLGLAIQTGCSKVVVKRPMNGGELDKFKPSYQYVAKANRFDVFLR